MTMTSRQDAHQARLALVVEQYKAVREHVVLTVNDRIANNRLLLAIVTVILGGEGFVVKDQVPTGAAPMSLSGMVLLGIAALVGAGVSLIWHRWNRSYKTSLRVRYDILREIEELLPKRPFARELELRKEYSYIPVSDVIGDLASMFFAVFVFQLPILAYQITSGYRG